MQVELHPVLTGARRLPWLAFFAAGLLLVTEGAGDPVQAAEDAKATDEGGTTDVSISCEELRTLVETQLLELALSTLQGLPTPVAEVGCVAEVSRQLAIAFEKRGDALFAVGAATAAQTAYAQAVGLDPNLRRRLARKLDPFHSVRELAAVGELSKARTRLEAILAEQPPRATPDDLLYLHGGGWEWWRGLRRFILGRFPTLAEATLTLLVAALVLLLMPRLTFWIFNLLRRKLLIGPVKSSGEKTLSEEGFASALEASLLELARPHAESRVHLATAAQEQVNLPTVEGVTATTTLGISLLTGLQKRLGLAHDEVSGALHDPAAKGPGVTLRFARGKRVLATTTLWQGDYSLPDGVDLKGERASYHLLAELSAVWALFQQREHSRWWFRKPFRLLGTTDWRAFALVQAGIRAFESGENERAVYCFRAAKVRDPLLYAAYLNLAHVLFPLENGRVEAERQIRAGIERMMGGSEAEKRHDVADLDEIWGQLRTAGNFESGASRGRFARLTGFRAERWFYWAQYIVLGLRIEELTRAWRAGSCQLDGTRHQDLRRRCEVELARLSHELEEAARVLGPVGHWTWPPWQATLRAEQRRMIADFAQAGQAMVGILALLVDHDKAGKFSKALRHMARDGSARLAGNVACLLSLTAECRGLTEGPEVSEAIEALGRAISLESFRKEDVANDPQLRYLVNTGAFHTAFGSGAPSEAQTALGELKLVGQGLAEKLEAVGIDSLEALMLATARAGKRRRLAFDLGLSEVLLLRWAKLAELSRIPKLDLASINFLERAGVGSLGSLANADARALLELLSSLQLVDRLEITVERSQLVLWIQEAYECLPSMVEGGSWKSLIRA